MSNKTANPGPSMALYSGRVIGAVVKALALDRGVLNKRTSQRFFAGQSVNEYSRGEVLHALGEVLIERGIVPVPSSLQEHDISMAAVISRVIDDAALRWDSLLAELQSRSTQIDDFGQATERFLRLVVVDLALRVFALMRLAGLEPNRPETPLWAGENGGGRLLRGLTERAGLSRDQLAARLEVSPTSVDNWLDGKNRPTPKNIAALAKELSNQSRNASSRQLEQEIQRHFTFAHLADLLVPWIGRERVVDLSTALVRCVWLITEDVRFMDPEEAVGAELTALRYGTAHSSTHALLRKLAQSEEDAGWKKDILASCVDWRMPFRAAAIQAAAPRTAAGLAQDVLDVSTGGAARSQMDESPDAGDPAREALAQLASEAHDWASNSSSIGRGAIGVHQILETGMALRRAIAHDFPLSPKAHYELGSFLGMAGKWLLRKDLIDQGIVECKIAAALLPNWDAPVVEPGIILANIGAFEEAIQELTRAKETLPYVTPHLLFSTGYVLMGISRYAEALEQFENVIDAKPDYALASLYAARCAFMLGDKPNGVRHAKTARRFGEASEYIAWKKGAYSNLRKQR